ncbi:hypothetical protein ACHAWF_009974 [Thalassiosira exigua]
MMAIARTEDGMHHRTKSADISNLQKAQHFRIPGSTISTQDRRDENETSTRSSSLNTPRQDPASSRKDEKRRSKSRTKILVVASVVLIISWLSVAYLCVWGQQSQKKHGVEMERNDGEASAGDDASSPLDNANLKLKETDLELEHLYSQILDIRNTFDKKIAKLKETHKDDGGALTLDELIQQKTMEFLKEGEELLDRILEMTTEGMTLADMYRDLECVDLSTQERPIHSQADWINARNVYHTIVGNDSTIGTPAYDNGVPNGFMVPVEVQQVPPKGRGIFASRDIPAGTPIWRSVKTARFPTPQSFREYVYALDKGFACDVLIWSYVEDVGGGVMRASVDLDEGSFCNTVYKPAVNNVGFDDEATGKHNMASSETYFAKTDIKANDELLCDYAEFDEGWDQIGM